jgi:hypothetical protein
VTCLRDGEPHPRDQGGTTTVRPGSTISRCLTDEQDLIGCALSWLGADAMDTVLDLPQEDRNRAAAGVSAPVRSPVANTTLLDQQTRPLQQRCAGPPDQQDHPTFGCSVTGSRTAPPAPETVDALDDDDRHQGGSERGPAHEDDGQGTEVSVSVAVRALLVGDPTANAGQPSHQRRDTSWSVHPRAPTPAALPRPSLSRGPR